MALNAGDIGQVSGVANAEEFAATPWMIALLVIGGLAILGGLTLAFRGAVHV